MNNHIQDDGSIDLWFNSKYHSKSSYPIAQLIRLKVLLAKIRWIKSRCNFRKIKSHFCYHYRYKIHDKKINGGFYEEFG